MEEPLAAKSPKVRLFRGQSTPTRSLLQQQQQQQQQPLQQQQQHQPTKPLTKNGNVCSARPPVKVTEDSQNQVRFHEFPNYLTGFSSKLDLDSNVSSADFIVFN